MTPFDRFWDETAPPDPTEAEWDRVLKAVRERLAEQPAPPARQWGWLIAAATVVTGAAAAVMLAVSLGNLPADPTPAPLVATLPDDEDLAVFPVAAAGDVEIIAIRGADARYLVVGESPLPGELVLAGPGDVRLEWVEPTEDGQFPDAQMGITEVDGVPMLFPPRGKTP
jgi:hypothetical protein